MRDTKIGIATEIEVDIEAGIAIEAEIEVTTWVAAEIEEAEIEAEIEARVGIHRRLEGAGVPQTGSESTGAWRGSSRIACSARVPLDRVRSHEFMHARYAVKCPSQLYPYKDHSTLHFLMTSAF